MNQFVPHHFQALNGLLSLPADIFDDTIQETFVTKLSDGTEVWECYSMNCHLQELIRHDNIMQVEIIPQGRAVAVTFDNVKDYVENVTAVRLNESSQQISAIRKGFNHVVPVGMLSLFAWLVC
jgi:HECT-domain (ubiquitin-transferase)